jgi:hypothetical protein
LIILFIVLTGLNPSFACQGFLPLWFQGRASPAPGCYRRDSAIGPPSSRWGSGSGGANVKRRHNGGGGTNCSDGYHSLNDGDAVEYTVSSGRGGPNCARPRHRGRRGGCVQLHPDAHSGGDRGDFWVAALVRRRARSGADSPPRVLSRAYQALHETEAAILREWEALEAEHQRLSDWRTQLEERTNAASHQFTFERSELERDRKDYKKDLQKVYAWELEVAQKEKRLAKKEEHLDQREEVVTELQAKLSAFNKILEEQRVQQTTAVESLHRLQRELEDKASSIALAEENLKEKDASLDKRATDLA